MFSRKSILAAFVFSQLGGCPIPELKNNREGIPPIAVITPRTSISGDAPLEVNLSFFDSFDPDDPGCVDKEVGSSCLWPRWYVDGSRHYTGDSQPIFYNVFYQPGKYIIGLEVVDRDGNVSQRESLEVLVF